MCVFVNEGWKSGAVLDKMPCNPVLRDDVICALDWSVLLLGKVSERLCNYYEWSRYPRDISLFLSFVLFLISIIYM